MQFSRFSSSPRGDVDRANAGRHPSHFGSPTQAYRLCQTQFSFDDRLLWTRLAASSACNAILMTWATMHSKSQDPVCMQRGVDLHPSTSILKCEDFVASGRGGTDQRASSRPTNGSQTVQRRPIILTLTGDRLVQGGMTNVLQELCRPCKAPFLSLSTTDRP